MTVVDSERDTSATPRKVYRIGQIVPSSNVTMETEIPAMMRAREQVLPERFTFHSSRMRMKQVTAEELATMDADSVRCASELSDAAVDVMGYACLVAIMSQGLRYHKVAHDRLSKQAHADGSDAPVVTSAGALIDGLHALNVRKIALITPYMRPLTATVVAYLEDAGFRVTDHISLEIPDNLAVAAQDPLALLKVLNDLDHSEAEAVVLSACVQMPSLAAIGEAEERIGKPVVSAATCTAYSMLKSLGLRPEIPNVGRLLSGEY